MEQSPRTKIYNMLRSSRVVKHKTRQEFLVDLIQGLISSRSVIFSEIADKIDKDIKPESIERRIQDFFQKVSIEYQQLAVFLLSFVHHKDLILSIDRTEWDFGKTQVNVLCVVASIGKMAVPLYFELLDNKSGNSNWRDRQQVLASLLAVVGKDRIGMLLMDREFIGQKWLLWLKRRGIPFCVRVPKHHTILFADGYRTTAVQLLSKRKSFCASNVVVDGVCVHASLSYGNDGELLYLVGTLPVKDLKKCYAKRWTIEVFFQALKGRGFNLEKSGLQDLEKYRKLFAVVCIAYTLCWATGIEHGRRKPVKTKKHGYPQYSIFRRGLNLIRSFFKRKIDTTFKQTIDKATLRLYPLLKTVG